MMPPATHPDYQGLDVLEAMESAHNYNAHLARLVEQYLSAATPVLDFGAGTGTIARLVAARGVDGLVCLEPDPALAQGLRDEGFQVVETLDAVADGSIAGLYSLNVIEHIEDDAAATRGLFRILAPGGVCFIYVPAFQRLFTRLDHRVGHFRRYRRASLCRLFADAGFLISGSRYVDSIGFFATLLLKAKPGGDGRLNPVMVGLYDRFVFPISLLLDRMLGRWIGKNVCLIARKPERG